MATDYTVILPEPGINPPHRHQFGDEPGTFNNIRQPPNVIFVGKKRDFTFSCPNVNARETAVLMFQSLAVDSQRNVFKVNGSDINGGIPASPSTNTWNGNIVLIRAGLLKPTNNVLSIESKTLAGTDSGNLDDFILDNVVVVYKTLPGLSQTDAV